jgi:hypothetical protein
MHTSTLLGTPTHAHTNMQYLLLFRADNNSRTRLNITLYVPCLSSLFSKRSVRLSGPPRLAVRWRSRPLPQSSARVEECVELYLHFANISAWACTVTSSSLSFKGLNIQCKNTYTILDRNIWRLVLGNCTRFRLETEDSSGVLICS